MRNQDYKAVSKDHARKFLEARGMKQAKQGNLGITAEIMIAEKLSDNFYQFDSKRGYDFIYCNKMVEVKYCGHSGATVNNLQADLYFIGYNPDLRVMDNIDNWLILDKPQMKMFMEEFGYSDSASNCDKVTKIRRFSKKMMLWLKLQKWV